MHGTTRSTKRRLGNDTMRWDNHRVVITAAGRDFGRTLAIRLADLGAEVFLSARRSPPPNGSATRSATADTSGCTPSPAT